jgi:hypothetical protein
VKSKVFLLQGHGDLLPKVQRHRLEKEPGFLHSVWDSQPGLSRPEFFGRPGIVAQSVRAGSLV